MGLISEKKLTTNKFPLPYLINPDNKTIEYSRYISTPPKKTDTKNQPTKLEFDMVPFDSKFVKLKRGDYLSFQTAKYGSWFTGFIINDPELTLVGSQGGAGIYGYKYVAMSDEYLINLKPMGIINPFFNMTHGAILSALIEDLCPGMYDLSNIQDGILQPRYQVDPTAKFTDITKAFCDAAQYILYAKEGKIYFQPATQSPFSVTIDGNDPNFTPSNLSLKPTSDPIINDATVLGAVEPQGVVTEYFAGDGFSGAYNLVYSPFGIDSTVLLTDTFSGSSLDSSIWTLYDAPANYITLADGYVNIIGGEADNTFDVHIDSACPIPIEGQIKLTHGEWDFLNLGLEGADGVLGVICAVWTQEPNSDLTGCLYGLLVKNEGGIKNVYPIVNGVVDTTQVLALDTANRYVIRTILNSDTIMRTISPMAYTDAAGIIQNITSDLQPTNYNWTTLFSLININTGVLMSQNTFTNSYAADPTVPNYALYIPVTSNDLHATFSNVTVDYPIQGTLYEYPAALNTEGVMGAVLGAYFDDVTLDNLATASDVGLSSMLLRWPLNEGVTGSTSVIKNLNGSNNVTGSWYGFGYSSFTDFYGTYLDGLYETPCGYTNGSSNSYALSDSNLTSVGTNWTISGWFNPSTLTGVNGPSQALITLGTDTSNAISVRMDDANPGIISVYASNTLVLSTANAVSINSWHHIAVRCLGVDVTLTVDGVTVSANYSGTLSIPNALLTLGNYTAQITVGGTTFSPNFQGFISDIRVFSVTLTDTEISNIYAANKNPHIFVEKWPRVSSPVLKSLGQNELDALDGMAPDATIADTVTGANIRSSLLGTPQYNTASAALTYFKDSVALVATTPQQGTLIECTYNAAGVATGRTVNQESIDQEAATWKDDGVRAIVKTDYSPAPRTSAECEVAAATLVGESCFQHYEGSYNFNSDFLTVNYEPISGTIMYFQNLSAVFPNIQAEEVTEVTTTFDSRHPVERFTHDVSFGVLDRVALLLAKYNKPTDVFAPTDSLETPISIGLDQAGVVFVNQVKSFEFNGMDRNNYYYRITDTPPTDGGFEVRLSDDSWGCSNGKNFVTRLPYIANQTEYTFSLPRNSRSKIVFVKAYDGRNKLLYSEDLTQNSWTKTNFNVFNRMLPNPDDDYSLISNVSISGTSGTYKLEALATDSSIAGPVCFTVDVKVPQGKKIRLVLEDTTNTETLDVIGVGAWQRLSVVIPSSLANSSRKVSIQTFTTSPVWANTFQITRASLEQNTLVETVYCQTLGNSYGALSRFSTSVRVNFPFIPPQPAQVSTAVGGTLDDINTVVTGTGLTATTTTIQQVGADGTPTENNPTITNPQVTVTLPDIQLDIFGVEIRASDNTTVLYRQNLSSAGYSLAVSLGNNIQSRTAIFYVYTYNVFGEYCDSVESTSSLPLPTVRNLMVNNNNATLQWDGLASNSFTVKFSDDAAITTNVVSFNIPAVYDSTNYASYKMTLPNSLFAPLKYITIYGTDSFGNGTSVQISHQEAIGVSGTYIKPSSVAITGSTRNPSSSYSSLTPELAYDSDQTTYGLIQATDVTNDSQTSISLISGGATCIATYTGFASVATTGTSTVNVYMQFSTQHDDSDVVTDGTTPASIKFYYPSGSGTASITIFDSTVSTQYQTGAIFAASVNVPSAISLASCSVVCEVQAYADISESTIPGSGLEGNYGLPSNSNVKYYGTQASLFIYDVYVTP